MTKARAVTNYVLGSNEWTITRLGTLRGTNVPSKTKASTRYLPIIRCPVIQFTDEHSIPGEDNLDKSVKAPTLS
jgi:hypothetical protein